MKCAHCSGELTVLHTEQMTDGTVKRRRECSPCGHRVTTYERLADQTPNAYEQRLVDAFRSLSKDHKSALWAHIRALKSVS